MAAAFRIDGTDVFLTTSVGIALYPIHGRALAGLVDAADGAMFEVATAGGDGCRVADLPAPAGSPGEQADQARAIRADESVSPPAA